jgi:ferredoxin
MPQPPTTAMLAIDRIACDGFGMCAELLPERIDLDDWGYPIISAEPVTPQLMERARRAVAVCPVLALRLRPLPRQAAIGTANQEHRPSGRSTVVSGRVQT